MNKEPKLRYKLYLHDGEGYNFYVGNLELDDLFMLLEDVDQRFLISQVRTGLGNNNGETAIYYGQNQEMAQDFINYARIPYVRDKVPKEYAYVKKMRRNNG